MRKTLMFALVIALLVGVASIPATGAASSGRSTARAADTCPPGATNVDYCQIGPSKCTNGKGVTQIGTDGDDLQIGSPCSDDQRGGKGNDTQRGLGGDDKQDGGAGNDTVDGADGNDSQTGGTGNDLMHGRNGKEKRGGAAGIGIMAGGQGKDMLAAGT